MARKSPADLAVVPLLQGGGRPPPPDLDATEQVIWRAVVDASPAYGIDLAARLLLRPLAAQAAHAERLEGRLRALRAQSSRRAPWLDSSQHQGGESSGCVSDWPLALLDFDQALVAVARSRPRGVDRPPGGVVGVDRVHPAVAHVGVVRDGEQLVAWGLRNLHRNIFFRACFLCRRA